MIYDINRISNQFLNKAAVPTPAKQISSVFWLFGHRVSPCCNAFTGFSGVRSVSPSMVRGMSPVMSVPTLRWVAIRQVNSSCRIIGRCRSVPMVFGVSQNSVRGGPHPTVSTSADE